MFSTDIYHLLLFEQTTNLKLYWFYTAEDLACKKTQKGHTTENSGKKFHIQKNPGNFVFFEFLIYLRENIRCYYHSIVLNSNSVVLWDSEDSFPESFIIINLYQSIMGFFFYMKWCGIDIPRLLFSTFRHFISLHNRRIS